MRTLQFKLGEHVFHIQSDYEYLLDRLEGNYAGFIQPIGCKDFGKPDMLIEIQPGPGVPTVDYHVNISTTPGAIIYERSDYRIELNSDYHGARISVFNELALKHALTNLYSAFIVHQGWGLLIHSSCVEHTGKAYLFAGQSGAGKSTVAKLSTPRPILSDEASIVKLHSNSVEVFPSPFNSELKVAFPLEPSQLSAIYLLIQSRDIKTVQLGKADAITRMLDKVFFWSHDPMETAKAISLCKQLVDKVPVYHLYFQKNHYFWELIS